jgi:hypothetical protein
MVWDDEGQVARIDSSSRLLGIVDADFRRTNVV